MNVPPVSIPNGLPRPFSPNDSYHQPYLAMEFQSRTGSPGHLASVFTMQGANTMLFQSRTGSPGHLACCTHSIAQEATRCKRFRESLYRRVFSAEKEQHFWLLFWSIRFWRLPRVYAQKRRHCDSRKADLLKERVRTTVLLSICPIKKVSVYS